MKELEKQYVRVEVIAQLLGLKVRSVNQLVQDNILHTIEVIGDKNRKCRRYELGETIRTYVQYVKDYKPTQQSSATESALKEQTMKATLRIKELEGQLKEYNLKIKNGEYLAREQVISDYIDFFSTFKKFVLSIPARVASLIGGAVEPVRVRKIRAEVHDEICTMLSAFEVAGVVKNTDVKTKTTKKEDK